MKKPEMTGVKGMLPLGCLPRWGREGVTLLTAGEYKQMIRKIGFQQSQFLSFLRRTSGKYKDPFRVFFYPVTSTTSNGREDGKGEGRDVSR
jgi:hypothetical protein